MNRLRKLRKTVAEDVVPAATFEDRLRDRFNTLRPAPAWAKVDDAAGAPKDADAARIDKLLASTASVLEGKGADAGGRLPAHQLEVVRERDGNIAEPCRAVVQVRARARHRTLISFLPSLLLPFLGSAVQCSSHRLRTPATCTAR